MRTSASTQAFRRPARLAFRHSGIFRRRAVGWIRAGYAQKIGRSAFVAMVVIVAIVAIVVSA